MPGERLSVRNRVEARVARFLGTLSPRTQVRLSRRPAVSIEDQELDAGLQLLLALRAQTLGGDGLVGPHGTSVAPDVLRESVRREGRGLVKRPTPVAGVRDMHVEGAAGPLRARHYAPGGPGPAPLLVFFHGGGFVVGDLDTHDEACRLLCHHGGMHVVAVDYRLAPEHPYPAAVDDATAALRWALANAASLGADRARVAIGGDSAGGNMSAVACQRLKAAGEAQPAAQLLVYPATDASKDMPSRATYREGFFLTQVDIDWFTEQYMPRREDRASVGTSPLLADDLSGLAPAIVVTAGFDPLRDEGEAYAAALRDAGVPVVAWRQRALIHGFVNFTAVSTASRDAVVQMAGMLRATLR